MTLKHSARLAAYLIILGLAIWDVYLLTVGIRWTGYSQLFTGPSEPAIETIDVLYMPYLPAWYSLAALLPTALGLAKDRWLPLAWLGLVVHLIVGGLLVFSIGFHYVPVTGLLAVVVGILQWAASQRAAWLLASAGGVAVMGLVGSLLNWTPLGNPLLVVAGLLALVLVALWRMRPHPLGA